MKTFLVTYYDGHMITVRGYSMIMAIGSVEGSDFIRKIEEI